MPKVEPETLASQPAAECAAVNVGLVLPFVMPQATYACDAVDDANPQPGASTLVAPVLNVNVENVNSTFGLNAVTT